MPHTFTRIFHCIVLAVLLAAGVAPAPAISTQMSFQHFQPPPGLEQADWEAIQAALSHIQDRSGDSGSLAETWVQRARLDASDGTTGDEMGFSIAMEGDVVVVGAIYHDSPYGAAHVFVKPASGWADMIQVATLSGAGSAFGWSVAISGDVIVVGVPGAPPCGRGLANVFIKPAGGWADMSSPTATLTASDGAMSDALGSSVAIDGDTILLGADGDNESRGAAYIYVKPEGGWANMTETAKLTASDGIGGDRLGWSAGISGNTAVVGPYYSNTNSDGGRVYVFVKPESGWANMTQTARLTASDGVRSDYLGYSVAIYGDTVAAGAYGDDTGNINHGSAYVFVRPVSGWVDMTQTAKLTGDLTASGMLGLSIDTDGERVVVGAPYYAVERGAAYVFSKPADGWADIAGAPILMAADGNNYDQFGTAVAITGDTVTVGASDDEVGGNAKQGAAYVMTYETVPEQSIYLPMIIDTP